MQFHIATQLAVAFVTFVFVAMTKIIAGALSFFLSCRIAYEIRKEIDCGRLRSNVYKRVYCMHSLLAIKRHLLSGDTYFRKFKRLNH